MSVPAEGRDELLERLLLDEASPLEAFERSELAGDARARAELEDLLRAGRRLEALGRSERASAAGPVEREAEERVLARFRAHLASPALARRVSQAPARRARGWGPALGLWIAAGLMLLLGLRFLLGGDEAPGADTRLGAGAARVEILSPIDAAGTFAEIVWRGERPPDGGFLVRVFDATRGSEGAEIATSPLLEENRWLPPAQAWTGWPDEIRLRVELHGGGPDELLDRSPEVRARRVP